MKECLFGKKECYYMVAATWITVVILELIHASKPGFAEGLSLFDGCCYMDNCGNFRADTCIQAQHCKRVVFIRSIFDPYERAYLFWKFPMCLGVPGITFEIVGCESTHIPRKWSKRFSLSCCPQWFSA